MAIGTFRRAVSKIIPEMTRVALISRKDELIKEDPTFNRKKFLFYLSRTDYQKEWGKGYRKPGIGSRILAWILRIIPKVGPFTALQFKIPTTQTEDLYIKSVDKTVEDYHALLARTEAQTLHLENRDCDTGKLTAQGEYRLSDATYSTLLDKLADHDFDQVSPELRSNIVEFYAGGQAPSTRQKGQHEDEKAAAKRDKELQQLKAAKAGDAGTAHPVQEQ
jgi:hypothetical protein